MSAIVIAVLALLYIGLLLWVFAEPKGNESDNERSNFERWRIEQAKQAAMDDIRRRRQQAEEQLRRLGRWSR